MGRGGSRKKTMPCKFSVGVEAWCCPGCLPFSVAFSSLSKGCVRPRPFSMPLFSQHRHSSSTLLATFPNACRLCSSIKPFPHSQKPRLISSQTPHTVFSYKSFYPAPLSWNAHGHLSSSPPHIRDPFLNTNGEPIPEPSPAAAQRHTSPPDFVCGQAFQLPMRLQLVLTAKLAV